MINFLLEQVALLFGKKKAYHSVGKVFLMNRGEQQGKQATLIAGLIFGDLRDKLENSEMWEGELVFIPHKIHRDTEQNVLLRGTICQVITGRSWLDPESYGENVDNA